VILGVPDLVTPVITTGPLDWSAAKFEVCTWTSLTNASSIFISGAEVARVREVAPSSFSEVPATGAPFDA